jgi:hypothetical protein
MNRNTEWIDFISGIKSLLLPPQLNNVELRAIMRAKNKSKNTKRLLVGVPVAGVVLALVAFGVRKQIIGARKKQSSTA